MSQQYYTLVTNIGAARIAKATALGTVVNLSQMAVGDGGGKPITPSATATALTREVYRASLNMLEVDENNQKQVIAELLIPEEEGDFTIREVGLFDNNNNLIAIGSIADSYKPRLSSGTASQQIIRMVIQIDNTDAVGLKVDPAVVLATREFVEQTVNKKFGNVAYRVPSIAALREFNKPGASAVIVENYHEGINGGGGVFVISNTNLSDDNAITIVSDAGVKWVKIINGNRLSFDDFGIKSNEECSDKIKNALEVCAGKYELFAPKGEYLIGKELKIPSNTKLIGAGMEETIFKADKKLPAMANLITNKSNNYEKREEVDINIHLSDFMVDADWRGRYSIGTHINNQACGIKLSAVKNSTLTNVKAINAVLHCFDICADQYLDDGDVTSNVTNQSEHIKLKGCVAINPYRDDAFTTHNSRYVAFEDCLAIFNGEISELGNTQQGFEADEGSAHISIKNCIAQGFHCGFQSKGHATTKPAESTIFENCISEKCAFGGMASVGHNPTGKTGYSPQSVVFRDFVVKKPTGNKHLPNPVALLIYGADGVVIDGITVDGSANIVIEQGAGKVNLGNITFKTEIGSNYNGLIEIKDTVTSVGAIKIENLIVSVSQKIPAIFKNSASARLVIDSAFIPNNGQGESTAIKMKRQARDRIVGVWTGCKYTVDLIDEGYKLTGDVKLDAYKRIYLSGNPVISEPHIKAPIGTVCTSQWGEEWVQRGTDGNLPNWVKTVK